MMPLRVRGNSSTLTFNRTGSSKLSLSGVSYEPAKLDARTSSCKLEVDGIELKVSNDIHATAKVHLVTRPRRSRAWPNLSELIRNAFN